jgi:hypothetical protein
VNLVGAKKSDGDLTCDGGQFSSNGERLALNANGVEVKRHVFLDRGFKAEGGVSLVAARIDGNLELMAASLSARANRQPSMLTA